MSERSGTTAVDVWTRPGPLPRGFAGRALADSVGADSVSRVLVRPERGPRAIRGVESLHGPERWIERMGGYVWGVSPPSFFQVNTAQAEALVQLVVEALEPAKRSRLHVFLATSAIHRKYKLKMATEAILKQVDGSVRYARRLSDDVEF